MQTNEREPTPEEIREALNRPSDFGLSSSAEHADEMFVTWSLGPVIRTRDSNLLELSNADALEKMLNEEHPDLRECWTITTCRHWAVGWVEHLSFEAVDKDGEPTKIFRVLCAWRDMLSEYPCADESDLSRREYDGTCDFIRDEGSHLGLKRGVRDDWPEDVYSWLWENEQKELEISDGDCAYPSRESIRKAMAALRILEEDEEEEA